jgi:hypothetical protein
VTSSRALSLFSIRAAHASSPAVQIAWAAAAPAAAFRHPSDIPVLAPRLAASYKITMAITMGYMLITML